MKCLSIWFISSYGFSIILVDYLNVIKIGNKLLNNKINSLKDTLNYLYENRKIPSMIDLRYKDGVALDYGK